MEMNVPQPVPPRGCSRPVRACAISLLLLILAVIALVVYVVRMPAARALFQCQQNMIAIGEALKRYEDVNDVYPRTLDDLKKDYLKDPSVLSCPTIDGKKDESCYTYHRPGPRSGPKFVVLECSLHRLKPGTPIPKLQLLKDGTVRAEGQAPGRSRANDGTRH